MINLQQTQLMDYLAKSRLRVDTQLDALMPALDVYPELIHESMRYSIFAGGKRFRPALTLAAFDACGGQGDAALDTACALEMIHTYSLIHDDLPAMDDDDMRRGMPSNHKKFGEDMAILAGDALLTLAFYVMDERVVKDIALAIGSEGVVGGQVVDILLNKGVLSKDLKLMEFIHRYKTGALIAVSCLAGAKIAGASADTCARIKRYGEHIGLAFQIIDDVFDDENYAELLGVDKAREVAQGCVLNAKRELECLPKEQRGILELLADFVVQRDD